MRLLIATSNPGKLRDFAHAALAFPDLLIEPLPGVASIPPPEEDAPTFAGNALLKARAYSALAPGAIVLADDSGIVVPALAGAPGVRSARYAEDLHFDEGATIDERNQHCLLHRAEALAPDQRHAQYECVLVAMRDGELLASSAGAVQGTLLLAPRGTAGFGYDPIFLLPDLDLTMAEVDMPTRLRLSHRGRALVALLQDVHLLKHFCS